MKRRKRLSNHELALLSLNQHEPTSVTRAKVRAHSFNRVPHEIIARILNISLPALRYWYWSELELTEHEILAIAAQNVMSLANQTLDLGVALRANETLLRTRSIYWREPKAAEPPADALPVTKVEQMTLQQVEMELARIGIRAAAAGSADAPSDEGAKDPADPAKPE